MRTDLPMKMAVVVLLISLGALSGPALAADTPATPAAAKLPTAKDVIAKHVQAIGGREAILKKSALRGKGKFEMAAQGVSGELELLRAKPNKQVLRVSVGAFGDVTTGFDGKIGWLILPGSGPVLMQGKMLEQTRDDAEFFNQLHEESNFLVMETVAKTEFAGQECYQLKLVYKSGREVAEFYNTKSGLEAGLKGAQESPQGEVQVTTILSDYKKFGDILHPTKMTQKIGEIEQVVTISDISYGPVPEKEFEAPEQVKALLSPQPAK